jgi:hypothetical protein
LFKSGQYLILGENLKEAVLRSSEKSKEYALPIGVNGLDSLVEYL